MVYGGASRWLTFGQSATTSDWSALTSGQSAAKAYEHILDHNIGHSHFIFGYVVVYGETCRLDFGLSATTSDWSALNSGQSLVNTFWVKL